MEITMITIDPGYQSGVVLWSANSNKPVTTRLLKAPSYGRNDWRVSCLLQQFFDELCTLEFAEHCELYVEYPSYFSSAGGFAAAARGDLVSLAFLTGALFANADLFVAKNNRYIVPVHEWKGQLPKTVVNDRIRKAIGEEYPNHIADAVGIGLWIRGIL